MDAIEFGSYDYFLHSLCLRGRSLLCRIFLFSFLKTGPVPYPPVGERGVSESLPDFRLDPFAELGP
jgi:hypothetical protein